MKRPANPIEHLPRKVMTEIIPEQALRQKIAELEMANCMLNDFAALVAHDIRSGLRRVISYAELLGLVRRAANLFTSLAGARPGVAYMLPSLVETHATLWGAETAGYAVPINFLLQPAHIAELLKASGARVLVALGLHPVLDIWQKALAVRDAVPGLTLLRVAPLGTPAEEGVIDFHTALMAQPDDRLVFGEPGRDGDVAAYFHTGGTTGAPKLVAHSHRGQLVAALGGAILGDMRPTDTLTATLPLFHVGGTIFCGLSVFMAGTGLLVMSPGGLRNPAMVQAILAHVGREVPSDQRLGHGLGIGNAFPEQLAHQRRRAKHST